MNAFNLYALACACLAVALVHAAPTTVAPAGQETPTTTVTSASASSSTAASDLARSAPATDGSAHAPNTTSSMAVSTTHDNLNASSFTCYGRMIGYYADPDHECKVYHFCLLGDYNGDAVYQRISYLCLNGTLFDQQALDCVDPTKMSAPCKDSATHYETSNAVLRDAIVGQQVHDSASSNSTAVPATKSAQDSTAAPATTTTPAAPAPTTTAAPASSSTTVAASAETEPPKDAAKDAAKETTTVAPATSS